MLKGVHLEAFSICCNIYLLHYCVLNVLKCFNSRSVQFRAKSYQEMDSRNCVSIPDRYNSEGSSFSILYGFVEFQFQIGTIQRNCRLWGFNRWSLFQFQIGTIQSLPKKCRMWHCESFNSRSVQFRACCFAVPSSIEFGFNSRSVQFRATGLEMVKSPAMSFNSRSVQFREITPDANVSTVVGFNSRSVQFREMFSHIQAMFHGCFNSRSVQFRAS